MRLARTPLGQATRQQGAAGAVGGSTGPRVQREAELAARPPADSWAPSGRLREAYLAVRAERDELAVLLAQIEAYEPGIAAKAKEWVEQVDAVPGRRHRGG